MRTRLGFVPLRLSEGDMKDEVTRRTWEGGGTGLYGSDDNSQPVGKRAGAPSRGQGVTIIQTEGWRHGLHGRAPA
jgi:hypothetical protein